MKRLVSMHVKNKLKDINGSHGWDHTERVRSLALHIGKKENADLEVLEYSAILHDVARPIQDDSNGVLCHAKEGVKEAKKVLTHIELPEEKINQILHCIESHRFRNDSPPESKEAKILYDADKLDAIGATGLGRAFLFAGGIGASLHNPIMDISKTKSYSKDDTAFREFSVKLSKVKDKMFTNAGKEIAISRHNFMVNFFNQLDKEHEGLL